MGRIRPQQPDLAVKLASSERHTLPVIPLNLAYSKILTTEAKAMKYWNCSKIRQDKVYPADQEHKVFKPLREQWHLVAFQRKWYHMNLTLNIQPFFSHKDIATTKPSVQDAQVLVLLVLTTLAPPSHTIKRREGKGRSGSSDLLLYLSMTGPQ